MSRQFNKNYDRQTSKAFQTDVHVLYDLLDKS